MKITLFFFVLGMLWIPALAQESLILGPAIPDSMTQSSETIASFIKEKEHADLDRVKMAYGWVITHIAYDIRSRDLVILDEDRGILIQDALRKRKGVCENFAYLFVDICRKMGLSAQVIGGYTRQGGFVDKSPHAWCAVDLDHQWALYDPTWDEANVHSGHVSYFRVPPQEFIQTHMPFDPLFQMIPHPITYDDFQKGRFEGNPGYGIFDYADSMALFQGMTPLEQYLSGKRRIESNGTPNDLIRTRITQLKMEIEIIRQDQDSVNYNKAVAAYNRAVILLNDFISYRNNQFKPARSDSSVRDLFSRMSGELTVAKDLASEVKQSKATLTLETAGFESAIAKLEREIAEEKDFYLSWEKR